MPQEVGLRVKFERELVDAIAQRTDIRNKIKANDPALIKGVKKLILAAPSSWRFESLIKACRTIEVNSKHFTETKTDDPVLDALFDRELKIYNSIKSKHKKANEKLNIEMQELAAGSGDLAALMKTRKLREKREELLRGAVAAPRRPRAAVPVAPVAGGAAAPAGPAYFGIGEDVRIVEAFHEDAAEDQW